MLSSISPMAVGGSEVLEAIRRDKTLCHVWNQFTEQTAQSELRGLGPSGVDWISRTKNTLEELLPRLREFAQRLAVDVPANLNAAVHMKVLLDQGETVLQRALERDSAARAWIKQMRRAADGAHAVVGNLESQQISSAIQRYTISPAGLGDLVVRNGGSIYPDLILKNKDYSMLPRQSRIALVDGPCLRGSNPSNVPDGCEIKTNQGTRVKVDAHGAHPGLHLGVTWDLASGGVKITGVWVAYVRIADHRESGRNVRVTTVKYSFGHDLFRSIL
jgi:hypothetical protein